MVSAWFTISGQEWLRKKKWMLYDMALRYQFSLLSIAQRLKTPYSCYENVWVCYHHCCCCCRSLQSTILCILHSMSSSIYIESIVCRSDLHLFALCMPVDRHKKAFSTNDIVSIGLFIHCWMQFRETTYLLNGIHRCIDDRVKRLWVWWWESQNKRHIQCDLKWRNLHISMEKFVGVDFDFDGMLLRVCLLLICAHSIRNGAIAWIMCAC